MSGKLDLYTCLRYMGPDGLSKWLAQQEEEREALQRSAKQIRDELCPSRTTFIFAEISITLHKL